MRIGNIELKGNVILAPMAGVCNSAFRKICKKDKCSFWVNNSNYETKEYNQYNKELHEYVVNNYIKDEDMLGFTIYRNYKK